MADETFHKDERLCSRKIISTLFEKGHRFYCSGYQVVWIESPLPEGIHAQVAFSVSKKRFKRAVARNTIKRRLREAYRKNKASLYNYLGEKGCCIAFMIIFCGEKIPEFSHVDRSIKEIIGKLITIVRE